MKKEYRVSSYENQDLSPEETLVDSLGSSKVERPISEITLRFIFGVVFLFFAIFLVAAFRLQVVQGKSFRQIALGNRSEVYEVPALRGHILDRHGQVLAENRPVFDLMAISVDLPKEGSESELFLNRLSLILNQPVSVLAEIFESRNRVASFTVKKDLKKEEVLKIQDQFKQGIYVVNSAERFYPQGEKASAVIGYTGKINPDERGDRFYGINDRKGRSGVEESFEKYLRGKYGQIFFDRTADNYVVKPPETGSGVVLNIDAEVQKNLYEALSGVLRSAGIKAGAAVAQNPKTGEVLALVSLPSFDNNQLTGELSEAVFKKYFQNNSRPTFNRAISGRYNPGSTIKPLLALAGLREGVIKPETTITDQTGFITIQNIYNPEIVYTYRDWKVQGTVDLRKALAHSSDIYFYSVGGGFGRMKGLGWTKLEKYLKLFRIDEILGIDLPGEAAGFVPNEEWKLEKFGQPWFTGDTYNVSIGQGDLLTTPLWLSSYVSAIANGGIIYRPLVVKKVVDQKQKITEEFTPQELGRLPFEAAVLRVVQEGMRSAVTSGTAKLLSDLPVEVAAKTGTAEVGVKGKSFNSLFVAYAPYDNPEITISVLVENIGQNQGLAILAAKNFLKQYFQNSPQFTP